MSYMNELKLELLPHQPYSSDLTSSNFWLFPESKKMLQGFDPKIVPLPTTQMFFLKFQ